MNFFPYPVSPTTAPRDVLDEQRSLALAVAPDRSQVRVLGRP